MKAFFAKGFAILWLASVYAAGRSEPQATALLHPAKDTVRSTTVFMVGDSTMADKPLIPENPERGWGQLLPLYFKDSVRIDNHAANGRSTKSFIKEGRWAKVLALIHSGDYVIIQFGHNDEKIDTDRGTGAMIDFKSNLEKYVREARDKGGNPILATPVARRKFDSSGMLVDTHQDYPEAVRLVASQMQVPLLDLTSASNALLRQLGPERSKKLFKTIEPGEYEAYPEGVKDDTHFNAFGASRMCDLAVVAIQKVVPELAKHLKTNK